MIERDSSSVVAFRIRCANCSESCLLRGVYVADSDEALRKDAVGLGWSSIPTSTEVRDLCPACSAKW